MVSTRVGASLKLQFRLVLGSKGRVDLPDTSSTPAALEFAVFVNTRPLGSGPKAEMDVLDLPSNVPSTIKRDRS